jgi:hypothetical protein
MSLNEKESKEWTEGAYSEIDLHEFIGRIDSLQMDIQVPDPPNSTKPDSLKNK